MAARPPQPTNDERDPSAFGIAVVDDHISEDELSYPATREDVVDALDDPTIRCGPNSHEVSLSRVIERTGRSQFESRTQLLDELHEAFEQERRKGGGFVAWLRSLLGA
jgi:hypothetical protein